MSDPAKYRTKEEVSKMRKESDPIDNLRQLMLEHKLTTEQTLKDIDREIKAVVMEAATYAQECPEPDVSELYTDVLMEV